MPKQFVAGRAEKTIDIGGTSDAWDIPHLVEIFKILKPRTVLDVGTGCFGKNAYILRQYVEHKFRHLYGVKWMQIYGIEAYKPNYDYVKTLGLYDEIFNEEALDKINKWAEGYSIHLGEYNKPNRVDVVICTHVLEHHTLSGGWALLQAMYKIVDKAVIIASPYGKYKFEGNINPYQDHKSSWVPDEIAEMYPITSPIFGVNNTGHKEFLIVLPK